MKDLIPFGMKDLIPFLLKAEKCPPREMTVHKI